MQVADTTSTDNGYTVLESGQKLNHHTKSTCEAPCALHSPIDGPWSEWPRQYWNDSHLVGIYRVCPHNIAHPAVEQAIYVIKQGRPEQLHHECCPVCVCMPRAALPNELFMGKPVLVHFNLRDWATTLVQEEEEKESAPEASNESKDPNVWVANYLDTNVRLSDVPLDFFTLLRSSMLDSETGHYINEIAGGENDSYYVLHCRDECDLTLKKDRDGKWRSVGESWCPVVEIALLAGWVPSEWDWEDEEDD